MFSLIQRNLDFLFRLFLQMSDSKDKMVPGPECRLRGGATSSNASNAMPKVGPSEKAKPKAQTKAKSLAKPDHEEINMSSDKDKEAEDQADEKQDKGSEKKEKKAKRGKERHRFRNGQEGDDENPPLRKPCCFCWCCCCSCSW